MALEWKACVICGMGSPRTDWIKKSGKYVACDHHSVEELNKAVSELQPKPVVQQSSASPQTQTQPTVLKTEPPKPVVDPPKVIK